MAANIGGRTTGDQEIAGRCAFGTSVLSLIFLVSGKGGFRITPIEKEREVARPALFESAGLAT
jgi:hypothetical protein